MSSRQLVPLSYAQNAYNAAHGTELQTHTDTLTAEQAARINDNYAIEIHVGTHGLLLGADPNSPHAVNTLPTQQEYEEAAAVVADMQPGDTLFLEGYGFNAQPPEPAMIPDRLETASEKNSTTSVLKAFGQLTLSMAHKQNAEARRRLEQERRDYKVGVWDYAEKLAALKGIRTVYADQDAFGRESLQALAKGKGILELLRSTDAEDQALAKRISAQRERSACNLMKDWALDHLPQEATPTLNGRKPKLTLLFGSNHKKGLEQRFNDLGLNAHITVMESTNEQERAKEHTLPAVSEALAALMASLITVDQDTTSGGKRR
jgi:hypothetical protein